MKKRTIENVLVAVFLTAIFLALGIVGKVEHGGDLRLMWWTIPLIGIVYATARATEHIGK